MCGRGSTSETHKEVRFLNGSEASGKLRYRDSQTPMRWKAHAGKTSYAYSYVRTCAHAHMRTCAHGYMPRAYVHAANHGTATRDGIAASRRDLRGKAHVGKHHMRTHAFMRTCVYAYVRTQTRMYARTHVHMYCTYECAYDFFFPA